MWSNNTNVCNHTSCLQFKEQKLQQQTHSMDTILFFSKHLCLPCTCISYKGTSTTVQFRESHVYIHKRWKGQRSLMAWLPDRLYMFVHKSTNMLKSKIKMQLCLKILSDIKVLSRNTNYRKAWISVNKQISCSVHAMH